jgi:hypothetical protein
MSAGLSAQLWGFFSLMISKFARPSSRNPIRMPARAVVPIADGHQDQEIQGVGIGKRDNQGQAEDDEQGKEPQGCLDEQRLKKTEKLPKS